MAMDKKRIGIVLGDVAGVGPEIVVKMIDKNRNDIKNNFVRFNCQGRYIVCRKSDNKWFK